MRANLVVPLLKGEELWGLLCIHQCSAPRQWQDKEIEFVTQIAVQLGVALQQAKLLEQAEQRLYIHQFSKPCHWEDWEIELVSKIAVNLGVALQQAELLIPFLYEDALCRGQWPLTPTVV